MVKCTLTNKQQEVTRWIAVISIPIAFAAFLLTAMFDSGSLGGQLFFQDSTDTFMDYYNCLPGVLLRRPYDHESMYPPLAEFIFYLFAKFTPNDMILGLGPHQLRVSQIPQLSFLLFLAIPIVTILWALHDYLNDGKILNRFLILALFVSSPFLYMVERGNVIIYSIATALVFLCYYNSDKKWKREIALIALAISAGIKIYPAVLGLLLIKEKRWKDAVRCVIYGLAAFIIPFMFFGGLESLKIMINSLISNSGGFGYTEFGGRINFANIFDIIGIMWFGRKDALPWGQTVAYILSALLTVAAFLTKKTWKSVLFLTLVMIGAPAFSFYYTGVFTLLPFLMMIKGKDVDLKWTDLVYVLAFIAFLAPIPITYGNIYHTSVININLQICGVSLLAMTFWGMVDTVIELVRRKKGTAGLQGGKHET